MNGWMGVRLMFLAMPMVAAEGDFRIVLDGRAYGAQDLRTNRNLQVDIQRSTTASGNTRQALRVLVQKDALLEHVDVESIPILPGERVTVARGDKSGALGALAIGAFLELEGAGRFFSLDFAISEIDASDGRLAIGYSPYVKLRAGEVYETHAVTSGSYRLSGQKLGPYDQAAAEAFRRYLRFEYAPPTSGDRS